MAVSQTTITGPVYLAGLTKPEEGKIVFELSSWDREDGEATFISGPYMGDLDENGDFTVDLFTTTEGENHVVYNVSVIYLNMSGEYKRDSLGSVALAGPGPYCLADLEFIDPMTSSTFDVLAEIAAYNVASSAFATAAASSLTAVETIQTELEALLALQGNPIKLFASRAALVTGIGDLTDGDIVSIDGIFGIIDSTAVGNDSALADLSTDGVRLLGNIINARWWTRTVEGTATDASVLLTAANVYANAHRAFPSNQTGSIKFIIDGAYSLANPVVFGGASGRVSMDMSQASFLVVTGGTLASTPTNYAIALDSMGNVNTQLPYLNCVHICNGFKIEDCEQAIIFAGRVERFLGVGYLITGNCSASIIHKPTGYEWAPNETEHNTSSNFVADGILAEADDFKVIGGGMGWVGTPVHIAAGSGGSEWNGHHPYNGNQNGFPRSHPINVFNESVFETFFYDCYIDNGYVRDDHGTLTFQGGWHLVLPARVTMTHPYYRVKDQGAGTDILGTITDFKTSFGWFDTTWDTPFANKLADYSFTDGDDFGDGKFTELYGQKNIFIPDGTQTIDNRFIKVGDSNQTIVTEYKPGTGTAITWEHKNGVSTSDGDLIAANLTATGTFTPALNFGGAAVGLTYTTQVGRYQIVGSLCFYQIHLVIDALGSSTGDATITGLPVAAHASAISMTADTSHITSATVPGQSYATVSGSTLSLFADRNRATLITITEANFSTATDLKINGFFEIA